MFENKLPSVFCQNFLKFKSLKPFEVSVNLENGKFWNKDFFPLEITFRKNLVNYNDYHFKDLKMVVYPLINENQLFQKEGFSFDIYKEKNHELVNLSDGSSRYKEVLAIKMKAK